MHSIAPCIWLVLVRYILFYPLLFTYPAFDRKWISWVQHTAGCCFFIQSYNLFLGYSVLPIRSSYYWNGWVYTTLLLFSICSCGLCFFSSFLLSFGLLEYFFLILFFNLHYWLFSLLCFPPYKQNEPLKPQISLPWSCLKSWQWCLISQNL